MSNFAYFGIESVYAGIKLRLEDLGLNRTNVLSEANFVISYCTNMTALEDLYFGEDGIIQGLSSSAVAIDLSPCSSSFAKEISSVATVNNVAYVSAPLIVKNKVSADVFTRVNLRCFAACEGKMSSETKSVIEAIFGDVQFIDDVATSQLLRAANTLQNTAEMVAATEVLSLIQTSSQNLTEAQRSKLVPDATSPEAFFVMQAISGASFTGAYSVEMLLGELSAALMCADDAELILPQTEAAFHLFELLAVVGGLDLSPAALAVVYEGDQSEKGKELGLDWHRMESLYEKNDEGDFAYDDDYDEEFDDDNFDDYDIFFGDNLEELDPHDDTTSGFGYSVN